MTYPPQQLDDPLLKDTGSLSVPEYLQSPPPSRLPIFVGLGLSVLALGLAFAGVTSLKSGLHAEDMSLLSHAQANLADSLSREQRDCGAIARVVADDTRVRTMLATPGIDAATVVDVLKDIKKAAGISILGVVGPSGKIQAVTGHDALQGAELGEAALFKSALADPNKPTSGLWAFRDDLLNVAFAPIRLGQDVVAFALIARSVEVKSGDDRVTSALALRGVLQDKAAGIFGDVFAALTAAPKETFQSGGYVYQIQELDDQSKTSNVVWAVPAGHGSGAFSVLPYVFWALAALVVLSSVFLMWFARQVG